MKKVFLLLIVVLVASELFAGVSFTISGTIRNKASGESVIGATIQDTRSNSATLSNEYGFYALTLPEGEVELVVSFAGMKTYRLSLELKKDTSLDIFLEIQSQTLESVVISRPATGRDISSTQMGEERLTARDMKFIPQLFGEKDPLKAIQLLPGIKSAGEGNSGIYVRGGTADQNLILLDEAVVYNASHLLGFFSTFNADAVKDITVYKGGMPAQYGGRLSSVVDIRMNDGNNQDWQVDAGIGLISSRLSVQGPIQKGLSSFLLSGRSTYVDLFLKLSPDSTINRNQIGFYDLNAKLNYKIGKRDQVFLSGYFGNDHLKAGSEFGLRWGNGTGTLRWNHIYNNRIFSNTSLIYSNYQYEIDLNLGANNLNIFSQIQDWNLKEELQWSGGGQHNFRAGINVIHHTMHPGDITSSASSNFNDLEFQKRYSLESALFFSDTWKLSPKLSLTLGARLEAFSILGPGDFYQIDPDGRVTDTITVAAGKIMKTYFNPEPRISARWLLSEASSLKLAYVRNTQNLHLISNSTTSRPTDRWVGSTNNIRPEISDQISFGFYKDFAKHKFEFTAETYYKNMQHQIDYRDGADVNEANLIETQLSYGRGRAYGIEFLLKKRAGRLTGWLSYTLSKTEKKIAGINGNNWYNSRQDRTHDIAIVVAYKLPRKWTLSANWIFYTGDAVSFPEGKYNLNNQVYYYYSGRNEYRMPDYHRLDIGVTKTFHKKGKFESELNISVYNAYGRENAYTISFRESKSDLGKTEAVQTALFKFVPSITYNIKF